MFRRLILPFAIVAGLFLAFVALQPHTTVSADGPHGNGTPRTEPTHQPRPTATPIVVTATPVPVTNPCILGFVFVNPVLGCQPIVPPVPVVVCDAPNQLVPQATAFNGVYNPTDQVYFVNGQPYMNGVPYFGLPGYAGYNGINTYNGLGGYNTALACVSPPAAATPVPQPVIVQVQSPQAPAPVAQTVAPSLPVAPVYSYGTIKAPSTGSAGLLHD